MTVKNTSYFKLTKHAAIRMQQRGFLNNTAEIILTHADRHVHIGGGDRAFSVSRKKAERLKATGEIAPSMIDRIHSKSIVVSNDNAVITVMHVKAGKKGRPYRKGRH